MLSASDKEHINSTWATSAFFAKVFAETSAVEMMTVACDQIREMTGALTVAYIEHKEDDQRGCMPVVVNPERRFDLINSFYNEGDASRLCPYQQREEFPFSREEAKGDSLAELTFDALKADNIIRLPVEIDDDKFGCILLINLPDPGYRTEVLEIMMPIATCLCLALQKAQAVALLESKKLKLESEVSVTNRKLSIINDNLRKTIVDLEKEKLHVEEANRAKAEFLAIMSHELRTPLNPVIAFSEMLIMEEQEQDKIECLQLINQAGHNLLELINDLLDYNQLESGKYSIKPEKVDLVGLLKSIVNPYTERTSDLNFILNIDLEALPFVVVDPLRLRQIVVNLISNAIKHTEKGDITVGVSSNESNFSLMISDTGCGIPKEHLKTVFEPFKQINPDRNRHSQGTGLGLAIVKNLVTSMKGSISIESVVDKGTSITITLPKDPNA